MTHAAQPTETQIDADALAKFTEYFVRNYPGPDTVIFDPKWHAPKIFRAAVSALSLSQPSKAPGEVIEALQTIASQHMWVEMNDEARLCADFEGGYDSIIAVARAALRTPPATDGTEGQ